MVNEQQYVYKDSTHTLIYLESQLQILDMDICSNNNNEQQNIKLEKDSWIVIQVCRWDAHMGILSLIANWRLVSNGLSAVDATISRKC